ncbi:hypothetical protein J2Z48_003161 [Croceifilum oryzae]|uniref:Uncharacterized protein n=1 Tax=Croceifilum oryzae TaxID=1553429 RepID=A0AAJ1TN72_9BACL|nr:hypothetical protein [Croceifilum oryzae]
MKRNFNNRNKSLSELGHEFLVVCPSCQQCAEVTPLGSTNPYMIGIKCRMICSHCGHIKEMLPKTNVCRNRVKVSHSHYWKENTIRIGGPFDWYFGLPAYLQLTCCGHTLWAYNLEHLEYIESYVRSELRNPHPNNRSIESRLPKWIKSAKNREHLLKCIGHLKQSIS